MKNLKIESIVCLSIDYALCFFCLFRISKDHHPNDQHPHAQTDPIKSKLMVQVVLVKGIGDLADNGDEQSGNGPENE